MILVIRQERIRQGWTLEFVAKQAGVTKATLQRIETAKRKPSYDVLIKLEDLFGMTHRELFAAAPGEPHNLTE